jgi:hypothetical protein
LRDGAVIVIAEAEYRRVTGEKSSLPQHLSQRPSPDGVGLTCNQFSSRPANLWRLF